MGLKSNDWCPWKERFEDTKETHREDGGRGWSDAGTAREAKGCQQQPEAGRGQEDSSQSPREERGPIDTLILEF